MLVGKSLFKPQTFEIKQKNNTDKQLRLFSVSILISIQVYRVNAERRFETMCSFQMVLVPCENRLK